MLNNFCFFFFSFHITKYPEKDFYLPQRDWWNCDDRLESTWPNNEVSTFFLEYRSSLNLSTNRGFVCFESMSLLPAVPLKSSQVIVICLFVPYSLHSVILQRHLLTSLKYQAPRTLRINGCPKSNPNNLKYLNNPNPKLHREYYSHESKFLKILLSPKINWSLSLF